MPLRDDFPEAGSDYLGTTTDGWEYRTVFAGGTLERSFEMVRQFLEDEGFGDLPLPASADELRLFRLPKNRQTYLFLENGYVHNPIKILFPPVGKRARAALILCIFNEAAPNHLLRFHGVFKEKMVENEELPLSLPPSPQPEAAPHFQQ